MKIKEVEALILREGLTDELMQEYEKALRRSGSDYNRQQNCYNLGYELCRRDYAGALRLVEFAMQRYKYENPDMMRHGYAMLAHIHQTNGRADLAKPYLQVAQERLMQERNGRSGGTFLLLRNELILTAYQWSADLEKLYLETDMADELIWTMRPNRLLLAIAEYIVAEHQQNMALMSEARFWMERLLFGEEKDAADKMWERHRMDTSISLTEVQDNFLRRIGVLK